MNAVPDPRRIELLDPAIVVILKTKTPAEKLAMAFEIRERARLRQVAHFRSLHPQWTDDQVERSAAKRMLLVALNEPTRTIIRLLVNVRERGFRSQIESVEAQLRALARAIERSEVEFFATFFSVLDIWQAIVARIDSAPQG